MSFFLRSIGTAVPEHTMTQQQAVELAHDVICRNELQERMISVLYRKSGVEKRHTALPHKIALSWLPEKTDEQTKADLPVAVGPTTGERMQFYSLHAPQLAYAAAEKAIQESGIDRRKITHLVTVSCTGFTAPGLDTALINDLKLSPGTQRVQVGFMGCHGSINGLRAAHALAATDPNACVLMCSVEVCSIHYRFQWDQERIIANALFADGAAAVMGTAGQASSGTRSTEEKPNSPAAWQIRATGSFLIPDSLDAMTWRIGDHGFEMTLHASVPDLISQHLQPWLEGWLKDHGESLDSIGSWGVHPGGPRILTAVEESLNLPREATSVSRQVLASHGNMSSPTVLFILKELMAQNAKLPCVLLGFGPGMFAEVALIV